jgi:hypothetical protein
MTQSPWSSSTTSFDSATEDEAIDHWVKLIAMATL